MKGNAASRCSGSFLVWVGSRVNLSWEGSRGVSLYWPEWPPGLIVPWQVAPGVSLWCAGGLRVSLCLPHPPHLRLVVLGLVAGLPLLCLWLYLVFCDLFVLWTLESGQVGVEVQA